MNYYAAKQLAESFRTVRKNTIMIAEDIPEDQYGYRATPEVRSVAEQLAHIAVNTGWQAAIHTQGVSHVTLEIFGKFMQEGRAREQSLTRKPDIVQALKDEGETFAAFVEGLTEDVLSQVVTFPPVVPGGPKTRFEMLLSAKEHEMHHRGQLMLIERLLGIVPHLTRQRQAMQQQPASQSAANA
jgi:uncharacterized damage-inducible protein DinB